MTKAFKTAARAYLFTDENLLKAKNVPTLALAAIQRPAGPAELTNYLNLHPTDTSALVLPEDEFLVLAGTTTALQEFRKRFNKLGFDAIGSKTARRSGDPLWAWSTRAVVTHPDKVVDPGGTDITLIVIGWQHLFPAAPVLPWRRFPLGAIVQLLFDDTLDDNLEKVRKDG